MAARSHLDDLSELGAAVMRALTVALKDGEAHKDPGTWMTETFEHQMIHAGSHLHGTCWRATDAPVGEDQLAHLIARAAIAFRLREKARKPPQLHCVPGGK